MTVTRPPFDKKEVRQAINYAIDKQAIVDSFFEGRAEIAKNPMPPSISGYNDEIEGYAYDPEKAKELLAEAGLEMVLKWIYGQCQYHVHTCRTVGKWLKSFRKTLQMLALQLKSFRMNGQLFRSGK